MKLLNDLHTGFGQTYQQWWRPQSWVARPEHQFHMLLHRTQYYLGFSSYSLHCGSYWTQHCYANEHTAVHWWHVTVLYLPSVWPPSACVSSSIQVSVVKNRWIMSLNWLLLNLKQMQYIYGRVHVRCNKCWWGIDWVVSLESFISGEWASEWGSVNGPPHNPPLQILFPPFAPYTRHSGHSGLQPCSDPSLLNHHSLATLPERALVAPVSVHMELFWSVLPQPTNQKYSNVVVYIRETW